jgi:hypothetical protein
MPHDNAPAYGLWPLVIINSAVFIIFAFSFTRFRRHFPYQLQTRRDFQRAKLSAQGTASTPFSIL